MLVRIKQTSTSTITELLANLKTIITGAMTSATSNGALRPTNLTNIDSANSSILGTTWTNSNTLYSNPAGNDYKKKNNAYTTYEHWFKLSASSTKLAVQFGNNYANTSVDASTVSTTLIDATATDRTIDVIITDKIFFVNQPTTQGMALICDVARNGMNRYFTDSMMMAGCLPTAADTTGVPDAQYQVFNIPKAYSIDNSKYENTTNMWLHNLSADLVSDSKNKTTKVPLSTCYIGNQQQGLYPIYGVKGFANTPVFMDAGIMYDSDNKVYYTTGRLASTGTSSAVVYQDGNAYQGSQIVIEGE